MPMWLFVMSVSLLGVVVLAITSQLSRVVAAGPCLPPWGDGKTPLYAWGWPLRMWTPVSCDVVDINSGSLWVDLLVAYAIATAVVGVAAIAAAIARKRSARA